MGSRMQNIVVYIEQYNGKELGKTGVIRQMNTIPEWVDSQGALFHFVNREMPEFFREELDGWFVMPICLS